MKRKFRRSPFYDCEATVQLSEKACTILTVKSRTELGWGAFTETVCFDDGFLVFIGPAEFWWLPKKALSEGNLNEVEAILRTHVPKFRAV
jgi:hypothetical protein